MKIISRKFIAAQKKRLIGIASQSGKNDINATVLQSNNDTVTRQKLSSPPKKFTLRFEVTNDFIEELISFAIAEGEYSGDIELFLDCISDHMFDELYEKVELPDGYYLYTPVSVQVRGNKSAKYVAIEYEKNK